MSKGNWVLFIAAWIMCVGFTVMCVGYEHHNDTIHSIQCEVSAIGIWVVFLKDKFKEARGKK